MAVAKANFETGLRRGVVDFTYAQVTKYESLEIWEFDPRRLLSEGVNFPQSQGSPRVPRPGDSDHASAYTVHRVRNRFRLLCVISGFKIECTFVLVV